MDIWKDEIEITNSDKGKKLSNKQCPFNYVSIKCTFIIRDVSMKYKILIFFKFIDVVDAESSGLV